MVWANYIDGMAALFEQGGLTLWVILLASILLWLLIIERYWAHYHDLPRFRARMLEEWNSRGAMGEYHSFTRIQALVADPPVAGAARHSVRHDQGL